MKPDDFDMVDGTRESEEVMDIFLCCFGRQARDFYGIPTRTHYHQNLTNL